MRSATSDGCAGRRMGLDVFHRACASVQSAVSGVSTSPGATALTRTSGPRAAASSLVTWLSAALLAAYAIELPFGRTPAWLVTFTTHPFASRSAGRAAVHSSQ